MIQLINLLTFYLEKKIKNWPASAFMYNMKSLNKLKFQSFDSLVGDCRLGQSIMEGRFEHYKSKHNY